MKAMLVLNLCQGVVRPGSIVSCPTAYVTINNIIKRSQEFDFCYIINDEHSECDKEFKYFPEHLVKSSSDTARLFHFENQLQSKYRQYLKKDTFSALTNIHNQKTILSNNFDSIAVVGFCACIDILSTCIDLVNYKQNVVIIPECIDDMLDAYKQHTLEYLTRIGIPST